MENECRKCGKRNHSTRNCKAHITCFNCNRTGHTASECRACGNCGMLNHLTSQCTKERSSAYKKRGISNNSLIRSTQLRIVPGSSYSTPSYSTPNYSTPNYSTPSYSPRSSGEPYTIIRGNNGIYGESAVYINNRTGKSQYWELGANEV